MLFTKKIKATVVCKSVETIENFPDLGRANPFLELAVLQDKNKSMWFHDTFYVVTFKIGETKKQFRINKLLFDRLCEGDSGTLIYRASSLISFEK